MKRFSRLPWRRPAAGRWFLPLFCLVALSLHAADLALTAEEKAWLQAHPEWRAVGSSSPPFQWLDAKGEYHGLAADYDKILSARLGIKVRALPAESWSASVEQLKKHEIDACTLLIEDPERQEFLNFSNGVLALPTVVLVRSDNEDIKTIKNLRGKEVSVPKAWGIEGQLRRDYPEIHLQPAADVKSALIDVSTGKVSAYAGDLASTSDAIEKLGLSNLKVAFMLPYTLSLRVGVRKDWPEFIPILNKAIDSISDDEHESIRQRWMAIRADGMSREDVLRFIGLASTGVLLLGLLVYILSLRREIKLRRAAQREVLDTQNATIVALASLTETRDHDTGAHLHRTQIYVKLLAEELRRQGRHVDQLSDEQIELLYDTAPLHDIGKVGIPDSVLQKTSRLTEEEFAIMQTHTTLGGKALELAERECGTGGRFLSLARAIALTHHECWDGAGYPQGLKGEDIPLGGRLMAVADVYDALRSERCYKHSMSHEEAVTVIRMERGKQFDPDIVDAFLALEKKFCDISGRFADIPSLTPSVEART